MCKDLLTRNQQLMDRDETAKDVQSIWVFHRLCRLSVPCFDSIFLLQSYCVYQPGFSFLTFGTHPRTCIPLTQLVIEADRQTCIN
mmetsp:Transcript_36428/g.71691  ORF Transcript_36428/g.71691 Transcript_36428/m.71691 type:complete len:85 (+) Transcript_36428:2225-2479(+)